MRLPQTNSDVPKHGKKVVSPGLPRGLLGEQAAPPPRSRAGSTLAAEWRARDSAAGGGRGRRGAWFAAFRAPRSGARSAAPRALGWTEKRAGEPAKGAIEGKERQAERRPGRPQPASPSIAGLVAVSAAAGPQHPDAPGESGLRRGGREGGAGAQGGRVASPSRGARGGRSGADPLRGSEPGPGKLCRGGERGGRGGRRKLVSGRGALGSERAPAGGVCLSGFFVSPPGPSPSVRPA